MKQTGGAITFLIAQYGAILNNSLKTLLVLSVATATISSANAEAYDQDRYLGVNATQVSYDSVNSHTRGIAVNNSGTLTVTGDISGASLTVSDSGSSVSAGGDISVSSNLQNSGKISISKSDAKIESTKANIYNNGTLIIQNSASLNAAGQFGNFGIIAKDDDKSKVSSLSISSTKQFNNSGEIYAELLDIDVTNSTFKNSGTIYATDSKSAIDVLDFSNTGAIHLGGSISATQLTNGANNGNNEGVSLNVEGDINLGSGKLSNYGNLELGKNSSTSKVTAGQFSNHGSISSSGSVALNITSATNSGEITVENGELNIQTKGFVTLSDSNISSKNLVISASSYVNNQGTISSTDSDSNINTAQLTNYGTLTTSGSVTTTSSHFNNTQTGVFEAGKLTSSNVINKGNFDVSTLEVTADSATGYGITSFANAKEDAVQKIGTLTSNSDVQFGIGSNSTVNIGNLESGGSYSFNMDDLTSKATIATNKNDSITVIIGSEDTDLFDANDLNGAMQELANTVEIAEGIKTKTVVAEEGTIIGKLTAVTDESGNILNVSESVNASNAGMNEMANIAVMTWRSANNHMFKRLGDIRRGGDANGVWTKFMRGESKYGSQNVKNQYNNIMLGYDRKFGDAGNWIVGAALNYIDGSSSFKNAEGDDNQYGLSVYGSYLSENGFYVDTIVKYSRLENEYELTRGVGKGDYDINGYSASLEVGKTFDVQDILYIEPQVEYTYGYLERAKYTTSAGALVKQSSIQSSIVRGGVAIGKNFEKSKIFGSISYLYDLQGETDVDLTKNSISRSFHSDLGGEWFEFMIGGSYQFADNLNAYGTVTHTAKGEIETPWEWNVGLRYTF